MILALAGLAAAAALAGAEPPNTPTETQAERSAGAGPRLLYICERTDAARRSFKRQFGQVEYVSAQAVLLSRTSGERWDTPRCITPGELGRLERLTNEVTWAEGAKR
ncbi:MAG: hypothetical protein Q7S93_01570 [Phenylobacterium sp.]|uniref:hypothetical protein n=1 Tax=Phenylobacterium sp. TaxID=1871053 RepID=UPI002722019C|nr:hypothetical protein [Phenylobacterium sp.]MDO8408741.1 hypothetical protein [Phenylobacterium sp.]